MSQFWRPVLLSLAMTPILIILAFLSGGVGHGNYGMVTVLFPYAAMSALVLDRFLDATAIIILVAVLQFPIYGIVLGVAAKKSRFGAFMLGLFAAHALFALFAFWLAR